MISRKVWKQEDLETVEDDEELDDEPEDFEDSEK